MDFLRQVLGGNRREAAAEPVPEAKAEAASLPGDAPTGPEEAPTGPTASKPAARPARPISLASRRRDPAACPYCALLLDPAPDRARLCPRCRRPIVVRRVDGRRVLLTREALEVFESERDRESRERAWEEARRRWLTLARRVSAPEKRVARLDAAPLSDAVVSASRELYLASAERAVRTARRDQRWAEAADIRRAQAAALYREAGSPVPPPAEIVALHRAWSDAALRSASALGARVELVSGGCCSTCGRDNGTVFRIATELRAHRLPHEGCPRGLCACDWWPLPGPESTPRRPRRRPRPLTGQPAAGATPAAGPESGATDVEPPHEGERSGEYTPILGGD